MVSAGSSAPHSCSAQGPRRAFSAAKTGLSKIREKIEFSTSTITMAKALCFTAWRCTGRNAKKVTSRQAVRSHSIEEFPEILDR